MKSKNNFISKTISNLLVFIFCVAFVAIYGMICGSENSTTGVTLLIALMVMLSGDLGFNAKQAATSIFCLFILIAIAPRISLINPYIGLVVNGLSFLAILVITGQNISKTNHLTFILGYFFSRGYYLPGEPFKIRSISLIVGGLVIAVLYYFLRHKTTYKRNFVDLFKEMSIHSTRTRWQLGITISMTLILFVGDLIDHPRSMWIALALFSVMAPLQTDATKRMIQRIPAVIVGTCLFYLLYVVIVPEQYHAIVTLFAAFLSGYTSRYILKTTYNSFAALAATLAVFPAADAAFLRIRSNIIGTILGIFAFFLFHRIFTYLDERNAVVLQETA